MKKQLLVISGTLIFLLVAWLPCYGGEIPNLELLKEGYRQGEDSLDSYSSSALQNKGFRRPEKEETEVNMYVNCSTGRDWAYYGRTPRWPFKTISYAVSRIPYMRPSDDYVAIIHIAQGTYNESVTLDYDNVGLIGEGSDNTRIVGPGDQPTILVENSDPFHLSGLEITNGNLAGIYIYKSNGQELSDIAVYDSGFGIVVIGNSCASFSGDITVSGNNIGGISISYTSSAWFAGNVSVTSNTWDGIFIHTNSEAAFNGNTFVSSNNGNGVSITNNGSLVFWNLSGYNREFLVEGNGLNGISLTNGASITNLWDDVIIIRDNGLSGIFVDDGSSINFGTGGNTITGHTPDISLSFGARATFNGVDTIGSIVCDETALIRGNQACP